MSNEKDPWNPLSWFFKASATSRHAEFLAHEAKEAQSRGDILGSLSLDVFAKLLKKRGEDETKRAAESFARSFKHRN